MRVEKTRRGLRLVEGEVVLSELLAKPGPTHSLWDVLAACVKALSPGPRVALLGFAGGGIVAPLRAMGFGHPIEAVDLDPTGERLFRELSRGWAGDVRVARMDAAAWLEAQREPFDAIVEDLSVPIAEGTVKPRATFDGLPALVRARLRANGVAVTNLLPHPRARWSAMVLPVALPHRRAAVLDLDDFENRFVLAGDDLAEAAALAHRIRAELHAIGSVQTRRIRVRTLHFRRGPPT